MSIPLDRLYHYIESIAEEIYNNAIIIYRFYPHGSKKLDDFVPLTYSSWQEMHLIPGIHCNDQEPLNFNLYENYKFSNVNDWITTLQLTSIKYNKYNLKRSFMYDKSLLMHSECRSKNLEKYQQNHWIGIYYWSHALLALDWFRYAQHNNIKKTSVKKFLVYNRAWSGTREYRLKFADLLIDYNLVNDCQTSIGFIDNNIHYKDYTFTNSNWHLQHCLERYFNVNNTPSTSSADFNIEDYSNTDIEVVLETLFDDDRLHLTEKSLRPIACGQPFILAATHGSLEYLKSYGFKTFSSVIDESYDQIENPEKRLESIVLLMKKIANWSADEKYYKINQLQKIADYNKQHFFSDNFFNRIITELKNNLETAFTEFTSTKKCDQWIIKWKEYLANQSIIDFLKYNQNISLPTIQQFENVYAEVIKYSSLRLNQG